jgi:hypothetical protein
VIRVILSVDDPKRNLVFASISDGAYVMKLWRIGLFSLLLFVIQVSVTTLIVLSIGVEDIEKHPLRVYSYIASSLVAICAFTFLSRIYLKTPIHSFICIGLLAVLYNWAWTFVLLGNTVQLTPSKLAFDLAAMLLAMCVGIYLGRRFFNETKTAR